MNHIVQVSVFAKSWRATVAATGCWLWIKYRTLQTRRSEPNEEMQHSSDGSFKKRRSRENHAMRLDFSVIGAMCRATGAGVPMLAARSAGITEFAPSNGKSYALSSAPWSGVRSGRDGALSTTEGLRGERRRIAVRRRRCTRIHSAMRAWISTSTSSSMSSMMRCRRLARSLRRASSNDSSEIFEQVARYSSIGFVVFIVRVSEPSAS